MITVAACISQLCWVWFNGKARPLQDVCYYDAASRGPLGSLLLLYRLKTRFECSSSTIHFFSLTNLDIGCRHLACVGAGITLVSMAIGPSSQQTVRYALKVVPDPQATAQAVAAYTYDGQFGYTQGGELSNARECAFTV